jgi:hypothetical protein
MKQDGYGGEAGQRSVAKDHEAGEASSFFSCLIYRCTHMLGWMAGYRGYPIDPPLFDIHGATMSYRVVPVGHGPPYARPNQSPSM